MKNNIDELVEAMIVLAKRGDNIQQTAVTESVIPPKVNDPQLVLIPNENSSIQERHTVQDGYSSSDDATEYHSFAFSVPNFQGAGLMMNNEHPQDVEIVERYRVLEKRLKAI